VKRNKLARIILSRTDSIGDVILSLPMAGALKKLIPEAKTIFLCSKYTAPVVKLCEHVDEIALWNGRLANSEACQENPLKSLHADCIVHVFPSRKIAWMAKKSGIPVRIGTNGKLFHWLTCNRLLNLRRRNSPYHEAQLNLQMLVPMGASALYELTEIPNLYGLKKINTPHSVAEFIDPRRFNLVLHPKSKGSAREWGLENFSRLIRILPADRYKIFVTGTAEDGSHMKGFFSMHPETVDLTGRLSLDELISFIGIADGLVAASTGPLHIAAALGRKAVGIFSPMRPIHPGRWAPLGKKASFLVADKTCSDCRKSMECQCIRSIMPQQVKNELEKC
jgi:ADP-heptose:LPS heptosyltransferase